MTEERRSAPEENAAPDEEPCGLDAGCGPRRTPVDRGGALPPTESSDDAVEDASEQSFPASDPPSYPRIT